VRVHFLEAELAKKNTAITALEAELGRERQRAAAYEAIQKELADERDRSAALTAELNATREELAATRAELAITRDDVVALESRVAAMEARDAALSRRQWVRRIFEPRVLAWVLYPCNPADLDVFSLKHLQEKLGSVALETNLAAGGGDLAQSKARFDQLLQTCPGLLTAVRRVTKDGNDVAHPWLTGITLDAIRNEFDHVPAERPLVVASTFLALHGVNLCV